jgi:hypothetical protein
MSKDALERKIEKMSTKIVCQYTRVVGFVTPVKSWNSTRRKFEYPNRVFYSNGSLKV